MGGYMTKNPKDNKKFVKKETVLIVAFICLIIGFIGGIAFSVYKNVSPQPVQTNRLSSPMAKSQPEGPTVEQLKQIQHLMEHTVENPKDTNAWIQLGNAYFDTNQYSPAIQAYLKALDLNPDNPDVWTDLGIMYRREGQSENAIKAFDRAISIDPNHESSRFNKGLVLMHDLNDSKGAIKAWEELVAINPDAIAPGGGQSIKELLEKMKAMPGR
jgi:cytochrome c-type biogenesis protein CcmH/NrfG